VNVGPVEIIIVLVLALLVFGPKRLPQMGRSLGKGVREFRKAADTAKTEFGLGEVTDQINEVKGTIGDLKQSVDLKSAIEAPVAASDAATGVAGAGAAATAGSGTAAAAGAGASGAVAPASPETPPVASGAPASAAEPAPPEEPVVEAAADAGQPTEDALPAGAGTAAGPTTGA
jgi:TatA/E family protein of Tat protein translocase